MRNIPIRRAQIIAPFGVGAMFTSTDGTSLIAAGLDHWFKPPVGTEPGAIDEEEFIVEEWRLEEALKVNHFRLPPDYRDWRVRGERPKNLRLEVPFLRFPTWHFCPTCHTLQHVGQSVPGRQRCDDCGRKLPANRPKGRKRLPPHLVQVPFVAICEEGHIQDFPWREWVHRRISPTCKLPMSLVATGGASLAAQSVRCQCGQQRNLSQITEATAGVGEPDTFLSSHLADGADRYDCCGQRPWLADESGEGCGKPLRGSLRAATNVYFAHTASAIYLPVQGTDVSDTLLDILESPLMQGILNLVLDLGVQPTAANLKKSRKASMLDAFDDEEIDDALKVLANRRAATSESGFADADSYSSQEIRRPEYGILREATQSKDLKIRTAEPSNLGQVGAAFSRLNLVDQLRETRVLYGLSRVTPESKGSLTERKRMLWRTVPSFERSWLPAYVVRGEGVYIELAESAVSAWEQRAGVSDRVAVLAQNPARIQTLDALADPSLVPRFVLLHTFAHLLINQLVFDCGYSSASLRERIYCASGTDPMTGILIYTAAGDSEGTMGGLVRMGRPDRFDGVIAEALERAWWCSSDPVCMELGEKGQGPDSSNLAACHGCSLLPETACEFFNRFLDRGVVVGTHDKPEIGFFQT